MEYNIIQNDEKHRFELHIDGKMAFVVYEASGDTITFLHTEVPQELEGQGLAAALAKYVLNYARDNKLNVVPLCPYIRVYLDRHPEYQPLSVMHRNKQ
ncbi:GNAT family N-acetyltransferase [Chitinophagaceae bacterium MMS25-I14]